MNEKNRNILFQTKQSITGKAEKKARTEVKNTLRNHPEYGILKMYDTLLTINMPAEKDVTILARRITRL